MKTPKQDQEDFVILYLDTAQAGAVDILTQDFHEEFYQRFGGKREIYFFGSCPVQKAQRLLADMAKRDLLDKWIIGLQGHESGFPKWVYSYTLSEQGKSRLRVLKYQENKLGE